MINFVRVYLWVLIEEQDVICVKKSLEEFVVKEGFKIVVSYVENESGVKFVRFELFWFFNDCYLGDILLVEQVDCLS